MEGTILDDLGDADKLTKKVHAELIALRGSHGKLTVQKFADHKALQRVCGGDDLLDAFLMFEREMRRYTSQGSRDEAAAAISITAEADTALDRLEYVVGALPQDGEIRDQRTGRRWSDNGLRRIAADLVYLAQVQGRLGRELMTIEIDGNLQTGLQILIYQLTSKHLDQKSPLVRFWQYPNDSGDPEEDSSHISVNLDDLPAGTAGDETYTLRRHRVDVAFPHEIDLDAVDPDDPVFSISIEGKDAPMRSVSFIDTSELPPDLKTRFTAYRTIASIEFLRI